VASQRADFIRAARRGVEARASIAGIGVLRLADVENHAVGSAEQLIRERPIRALDARQERTQLCDDFVCDFSNFE